jgi:hypothetical protein
MFGGSPDHAAVQQRFASEKREANLVARTRLPKQKLYGIQGCLQRHVLRGRTERASLGVTIGAAHIAFLSNRQGKGVNPRDGLIVGGDWKIALNPQLFENSFEGIRRSGRTCLQPMVQMVIDAKHPRTLSQQQVAGRIGFEEMKSGIPRSTRRIQIGGPGTPAASSPIDFQVGSQIIHSLCRRPENGAAFASLETVLRRCKVLNPHDHPGGTLSADSPGPSSSSFGRG